MTEPRTFRYGPLWASTGVLLIVLSIVFPVLMISSHERVEALAIAFFAALAIAGILFLTYFAIFRITVSEQGMTVRSPFHTRTFAWSEVVAVRSEPKTVLFE